MIETKTEKDSILAAIKAVSTTPDAEWLADILYDGLSDSIGKYVSGHKEHGGSIFDRPLLPEIKFENIDQMHYIRAIETKVNNLIKRLEAYEEWNRTFLPVDPKNSLPQIIKELKNL